QFRATHLSQFMLTGRLGRLLFRWIHRHDLSHDDRGRQRGVCVGVYSAGHSMKAYEYRHVVGFEETNLVGNVYYVSHLRWQGRAREMVLRELVPEILLEFGRCPALITLQCPCQYLGELKAFDQVVIRMFLGSIAQNRIA